MARKFDPLDPLEVIASHRESKARRLNVKAATDEALVKYLRDHLPADPGSPPPTPGILKGFNRSLLEESVTLLQDLQDIPVLSLPTRNG